MNTIEKIEPEIIYYDQEILVCNKPPGLAVTRSQTEKLSTLQDWLEKNFNLKIGGRAGLVHRLDKATSGVIIVAKTLAGFEFLQQQFAARKVVKKYQTLVHNIPKSTSFEVELPIARYKFGKFAPTTQGRISQTIFTVLKKFEFGKEFQTILAEFPKSRLRYFEKNAKFYSLLQALPKTGRTHQIRVHAKAAGHPIVADRLYCPGKLAKFDQKFCPRLFLHAEKITFVHPTTKKLVTFCSKLPADLNAALLYLKEIP